MSEKLQRTQNPSKNFENVYLTVGQWEDGLSELDLGWVGGNDRTIATLRFFGTPGTDEGRQKSFEFLKELYLHLKKSYLDEE